MKRYIPFLPTLFDKINTDLPTWGLLIILEYVAHYHYGQNKSIIISLSIVTAAVLVSLLSVSFIDKNLIKYPLEKIRRAYSLYIIFIVAISIVCSLLLSLILWYFDIKTLEIKTPEIKTSEILAHFILVMGMFIGIRYIRSTNQENISKQLKEAEIELKNSEALQLQTEVAGSHDNIHFLLNQFKNIYTQMEDFPISKEQEMRKQRLLKHTFWVKEITEYLLLQSYRKEVPVINEVKAIKNFREMVCLEKKEITFEIQMEDKIHRSITVIPLVLFELVWNAYKYADNFIYVELSYEDGELYFKVKNDIAPNNLPENINKNSSTQKGLENMKERLQLAYDDAQKLVFTKSEDYFEVGLTITFSYHN